MRPQGFAGLGVQALEIAAHAQGEDFFRFRIAHHAGPAHAGVGHIGEEDIEPAFPLVLAGGGIGADDFFAFHLRAGLIANEGIKQAVHHDGRGAAGEFIVLPDEIVFARRVGCPFDGEVFLAGDAVHLRAAPVRPIHLRRVPGFARADGVPAVILIEQSPQQNPGRQKNGCGAVAVFGPCCPSVANNVWR